MNRHVWAYREMLRIYPRSFRERFGDEMLTLFADLLKDAGRPGERFGVARLWAHAIADLITSATSEQWEEQMNHHPILARAAVVAIPITVVGGLLVAGPIVALVALALSVVAALFVYSRRITPSNRGRGDRWWVACLAGVALVAAAFGSLALPISSDYTWSMATLLGIAGLAVLSSGALAAVVAMVRRPGARAVR
jgi:hypothetical protein